jgi:dCTP deaminase
MTIQSDKWIRQQSGMITPIVNEQVKISSHLRSRGDQKVVSYGVTSYGYDIRLAPELKLFNKYSDLIIDPKRFDDRILYDAELKTDHDGGKFFVIPEHGFALGRSVETFKIPRDVLVTCMNKSTYSRCGLIANISPLEPEWEGEITLEFSNTTGLPIMIYADEGVVQLLFFKGDQECETSYADRNGKYQGQKGITPPR